MINKRIEVVIYSITLCSNEYCTPKRRLTEIFELFNLVLGKKLTVLPTFLWFYFPGQEQRAGKTVRNFLLTVLTRESEIFEEVL